MFGFVTANLKELSPENVARYESVYCGICRQIRQRSSQLSRLFLQYDMAFLALLLLSLYEPEETGRDCACLLHPRRGFTDSPVIGYAADMNVLLAYYKAMDDWEDEKKLSAKWAGSVLKKTLPELQKQYPRQNAAVSRSIRELRRLEQENCANPDLPANLFGALMGELLVYQEDLWSDLLRETGFYLGRFIYLADAVVDYRRDLRRKAYNPLIAMGGGEQPAQWEAYLVLAMARCTEAYEKLPLVQDKALLDHILYRGVWMTLRGRQANTKEAKAHE